MAGFMSLPREIRDMIYAEALCVDGNIVLDRNRSERDGDHKGPPPTLALLSVNKQIRTEGLLVLFRANTWRITTNTPLLPTRRKCESLSDEEYHVFKQRHEETICSVYGRYFREIVIDVREIEEFLDAVFAAYNSLYGFWKFGTESNPQAIDDLVYGAMMRMFGKIAHQVVWMTNLESAVINIPVFGSHHIWCIINLLFHKLLARFRRNKTTITIKRRGANPERKLVREWYKARTTKTRD